MTWATVIIVNGRGHLKRLRRRAGSYRDAIHLHQREGTIRARKKRGRPVYERRIRWESVSFAEPITGAAQRED